MHTAAPPSDTAMTSRRRSTRSASTPAGMPNSISATNRMAKMAPTASGSVVTTSATHAKMTLLSVQLNEPAPPASAHGPNPGRRNGAIQASVANGIDQSLVGRRRPRRGRPRARRSCQRNAAQNPTAIAP